MAEVRRRGAALESAILDAGWAQLLEAGYTGLTVEAVAARARTGKAALYRRWPDKEALVMAVLAHSYLGDPASQANTGSLRGDVLALLRSADRLGDSAAAVLSTMLGAYFEETGTAPAELRARLLGDRGQAMSMIVDRALERGELRVRPVPRVVAVPFDLFRHEMIMNLGHVPEEAIREIVDDVFLPLVLPH